MARRGPSSDGLLLHRSRKVVNQPRIAPGGVMLLEKWDRRSPSEHVINKAVGCSRIWTCPGNFRDRPCRPYTDFLFFLCLSGAWYRSMPIPAPGLHLSKPSPHFPASPPFNSLPRVDTSRCFAIMRGRPIWIPKRSRGRMRIESSPRTTKNMSSPGSDGPMTNGCW